MMRQSVGPSSFSFVAPTNLPLLPRPLRYQGHASTSSNTSTTAPLWLNASATTDKASSVKSKRTQTSPDKAFKSPNATRRRQRRGLKYFASPDARPVTELQRGEGLMGTVKDVGPANSAWIDINVRTTRQSATARPRAVNARLRLDRPEVIKKLEDIKENTILPVHVHTVAPASARIEVRLGLIPPAERYGGVEGRRLIDDLRPGEQLEGKIISLGSYGAVVDVGVSRVGKGEKIIQFHGLLSRKHFVEGWESRYDKVRQLDATRMIEVGDEILVWVRNVYPKTPLLFLDASPLDEESLLKEAAEKRRNENRRKRRKRVDTMRVGEVRRGLVRRVAEFGIFVDAGLKRDVLVHHSETNVSPRPDPIKSWWKRDLSVGTPVHVQIVKVEQGDVAASLVALPLFQLEEARRVAAMPEATKAQVRYLEELEEREKTTNGLGALVPPLGIEKKELSESPDKNQTIGLQTPDEANTIEDAVDSDSQSDDEEDDDGEDEDEEDDEFSDEYFEDKYGF